MFILWFCWFGFNGGSSLSLSTDATMTLTGLVCFNTNLAAAVATCQLQGITVIDFQADIVQDGLSRQIAEGDVLQLDEGQAAGFVAGCVVHKSISNRR